MRHSIAVVIPAYNSESTVGNAIESALGQSRPPDEVIVVDDGSADGTAATVERFTPRAQLMRQANQGSAVARQTGTDASTADYIAYLDADDWWPEDKLRECEQLVAHESIDFMLADLQRARPGDPREAYLPRNSTFFPWAHSFFTRDRATEVDASLYRLPPDSGLDLLLRGFPVFPSAMLARRAAITAVGGWDARFRRCQDFDIGLRLARRFPLHYYDRVHAVLGLHDVNQDATRYVIKQTEGDIRVLHAHRDDARHDPAYRARITEALAGKLCALGYTQRKAGNGPLARDAYRRALRFREKRFHAATRWALTWLR